MADNFNFEFVIKIGSSAAATSNWKNTIAVITIIIFTVRLWAKSFRGRGKNRLFPGFIFHYSHAKTKTKTKTNNITPYCAVCLYEATDGERLRQLPGCNHCFHVECVDAWLEYRPTCPLCRSQVSLHQNHQHGFFQCCRICVGKWGIISIN